MNFRIMRSNQNSRRKHCARAVDHQLQRNIGQSYFVVHTQCGPKQQGGQKAAQANHMPLLCYAHIILMVMVMNVHNLFHYQKRRYPGLMCHSRINDFTLGNVMLRGHRQKQHLTGTSKLFGQLVNCFSASLVCVTFVFKMSFHAKHTFL